MNKNKAKTKRGMTLIEVIISVALLSILLIPISGLVMSSFKNNKKSEDKQNATYIGQKILEELKAYDEITLKEDEEGQQEEVSKQYFELLDGGRIYKLLEGNTFKGSFDTGVYGTKNIKENKRKYTVNVIIKEDEKFKYKDIDNLEENKDAAFTLKFTENTGKKVVTIEDSELKTKEFFGDIIIRLEEDRTLSIIDKENKEEDNKENKDEIISYKDIANLNNKIVLFFDENYKANNKIEVESNLKGTGEIYIIKDGDIENYNVEIVKGNFIINGGVNRIEKNLNGNRFNYEVEVKNNVGKTLFKSGSSKNILIN